MKGYLCVGKNQGGNIIMQLSVFCDNSLILVGGKDIEKEEKKHLHVSNKMEMARVLTAYFAEDEKNDMWLLGYDEAKMVSDFKAFFKYVEAAGGLVRHPVRGYLFIRRFGIPDLPKGKLKKRESSLEGAKREVKEETGVDHLKIIEALPSTFHVYRRKGEMFLKKTFWYAMESDYSGGLTPQTEEEITQVEWLDPENARKALNHSYRSLSDTLTPFICD